MQSKRYKTFYYSLFVLFGISFIAYFTMLLFVADTFVNNPGRDFNFSVPDCMIAVSLWLSILSVVLIICLSIYNLISSKTERSLKTVSVVILSVIVFLALAFFILSQIKFGKFGG